MNKKYFFMILVKNRIVYFLPPLEDPEPRVPLFELLLERLGEELLLDPLLLLERLGVEMLLEPPLFLFIVFDLLFLDPLSIDPLFLVALEPELSEGLFCLPEFKMRSYLSLFLSLMF